MSLENRNLPNISLLCLCDPCLFSSIGRTTDMWDNGCLLCPPSKKRGYIVLLMLVGISVGQSVDQMVSADHLKYHLSQSLHISHVDSPWLVDDPYWIWGHKIKGQVQGGICVVRHFLFHNLIHLLDKRFFVIFDLVHLVCICLSPLIQTSCGISIGLMQRKW